MKIAVTTPTGHVGKVVADLLLNAGKDSVKLLCRRPEKLRASVEQGAQIAVGSMDDADYLIRATQGCDAMLCVTPPAYGSDNLRGFQNRVGKAMAAAVRANKIARVVNLSSIGAQWSSGVGPINGLHDVENWINDAATNVIHLRAGFFFENFLAQLEAIRNGGRISWPLPGSCRYPMIATRDIGRVAADLLRDGTWSGGRVRELHGPTDLSFDGAAEILSEALGRKIEYVRCEPREMRQMILDNAVSENIANLLLEMYDAIETGRLRATQRRSPETTTPTTLAEFAQDVIAPLLATPAAH
jgi:uncharacterized protein YbjT (DUF2867 family)